MTLLAFGEFSLHKRPSFPQNPSHQIYFGLRGILNFVKREKETSYFLIARTSPQILLALMFRILGKRAQISYFVQMFWVAAKKNNQKLSVQMKQLIIMFLLMLSSFLIV